MKNQTLIAIIIGTILVWAYMRKRKSVIPPATFHPPGQPSHRSGAGEGSALSNGYDFFELYQHQSGLGPVDEGTGGMDIWTSNPNEGIAPAVNGRSIRLVGNFNNGDGTNGYSPKVGHPTNNVRLLPGKINSGNRQGLTQATQQ